MHGVKRHFLGYTASELYVILEFGLYMSDMCVRENRSIFGLPLAEILQINTARNTIGSAVSLAATSSSDVKWKKQNSENIQGFKSTTFSLAPRPISYAPVKSLILRTPPDLSPANSRKAVFPGLKIPNLATLLCWKRTPISSTPPQTHCVVDAKMSRRKLNTDCGDAPCSMRRDKTSLEILQCSSRFVPLTPQGSPSTTTWGNEKI